MCEQFGQRLRTICLRTCSREVLHVANPSGDFSSFFMLSNARGITLVTSVVRVRRNDPLVCMGGYQEPQVIIFPTSPWRDQNISRTTPTSYRSCKQCDNVLQIKPTNVPATPLPQFVVQFFTHPHEAPASCVLRFPHLMQLYRPPKSLHFSFCAFCLFFVLHKLPRDFFSAHVHVYLSIVRLALSKKRRVPDGRRYFFSQFLDG